jgi:hypothetical protein
MTFTTFNDENKRIARSEIETVPTPCGIRALFLVQALCFELGFSAPNHRGVLYHRKNQHLKIDLQMPKDRLLIYIRNYDYFDLFYWPQGDEKLGPTINKLLIKIREVYTVHETNN